MLDQSSQLNPSSAGSGTGFGEAGGGGFGPPRGLRVQYQIPKNPVVPTKEEMERKYTRQARYEREKEKRCL